MKKLGLLPILIFVFQWSNAKVITVSNTAEQVAQYADLQKAFDDALVDDTVYIHGSPVSYGNVTIRKRLVVIGAGYNPIETQFQFPTKLGALNLDSTTTGGLGGTGEPIIGLKIYSLEVSTIGSSNAAWQNFFKKNVTIERCKVTSTLSVTGAGWIIVNNWIAIVDLNNFNNVLISNNFISRIGNSNQSSVVFTHNIFLPNGGGTNWSGEVVNANFNSNIFLNNNPTVAQIRNCVFTSNIIGNATALPLIENVNNNTGSGNFNNTNPLFAKMPTPPPTSITDLFERDANNQLRYDFNLSASSVGKGKGSGGSDIGIYGGGYPLTGLGGASTLPQITRMDISNSVLPKTEKLKVSFKARRVN